jgi:translation initiation factor IF-3
VIKRSVSELEGMGHPDAEAKLIGRNIHVMLTPLPVNKRKPKFHLDGDGADDEPETPEAPSAPAAPPPPPPGGS